MLKKFTTITITAIALVGLSACDSKDVTIPTPTVTVTATPDEVTAKDLMDTGMDMLGEAKELADEEQARRDALTPEERKAEDEQLEKDRQDALDALDKTNDILKTQKELLEEASKLQENN